MVALHGQVSYDHQQLIKFETLKKGGENKQWFTLQNPRTPVKKVSRQLEINLAYHALSYIRKINKFLFHRSYP